MVTERSHELYHFNYADTRYQLLQQVSILPKDHPEYAASTTAAIRLSPDGRFLYTSTRALIL